MYNLMNNVNYASVLAEDVQTPELRNPLLMRLNQGGKGEDARNWLTRLFGRK